MINLGLSAAEQKRFHEALVSNHFIKITVQFLDMNHRYISDVSSRLIDGQVNLSTHTEIRRSATVTLLDSQKNLGLDSNNPADGQAYLDRMIKIVYSVWVEASNDWVDVPIFCGPITRLERNEDVLELEAQGKEVLARRPAFKARTWNKGLKRTSVLKAILSELTGETRFQVPDWSAKTAEAVVVNPLKHPWIYAYNMAKGVNAQMFYDGRGVLRVRKVPTRSLWTFKDGDGGCVLTKPDVAFDNEELINTVVITGGKPKGAKTPVKATAYFPKAHPQSPHSLGRNGVPRYLPEYIVDDTLKSTKAAQEAANRRIKELTTESAEVTFDSLPIPHLEEGDLVRVEVDGLSVTFRLREMTIPLSHGGVSTVGYLRKVSRNTKRIRRNR